MRFALIDRYTGLIAWVGEATPGQFPRGFMSEWWPQVLMSGLMFIWCPRAALLTWIATTALPWRQSACVCIPRTVSVDRPTDLSDVD